MAATFALMGANPMLLRGTEGEPVADARRIPQMELFRGGQRIATQAAQSGPLSDLPALPRTVDAARTADDIRIVLTGALPLAAPIALQVELIRRGISHLQARVREASAQASA